MLCFPAINLSQLHKSANINGWWELCKHNTCNGEFRGSLPFVHLLVLLLCFFKAVSELLHLPSTCDFSQHNHPATGSIVLCAIQDLCDGVSHVCGVGILYLTAEGQCAPCSQEDGIEDMTKFVLEFNVKWKICKGHLTQTLLKPLCVLGNQISGSSYPTCIYHRSHSFLTYIEIWTGTGNLRFSSHLSCWIKDSSLPVQLLLSLRQIPSSPCAFFEVWAVQPLEMDHWTDYGFDHSFLKNKRKKPKQTNRTQ